MTIPRGDIHVEKGSDPVDIYCRLNPAHEYFTLYGVSRLGLYVAGGDGGGPRRLPTRVVNETTVMATYEPSSHMSADLITCSMDVGGGQLKGVCNQNIYVGSKFYCSSIRLCYLGTLADILYRGMHKAKWSVLSIIILLPCVRLVLVVQYLA